MRKAIFTFSSAKTWLPRLIFMYISHPLFLLYKFLIFENPSEVPLLKLKNFSLLVRRRQQASPVIKSKVSLNELVYFHSVWLFCYFVGNWENFADVIYSSPPRCNHFSYVTYTLGSGNIKKKKNKIRNASFICMSLKISYQARWRVVKPLRIFGRKS